MISDLPKTDGIMYLERKRTGLSDLKAGQNTGVVVTKVIAPVNRDADVPVSFLVADADGTVMIVSLYNVTPEVLDGVKVGNTVAVIDPLLKIIALRSQPAGYPCIHVTNPFQFVVNGRRLHSSAIAPATVSIEPK